MQSPFPEIAHPLYFVCHIHTHHGHLHILHFYIKVTTNDNHVFFIYDSNQLYNTLIETVLFIIIKALLRCIS